MESKPCRKATSRAGKTSPDGALETSEWMLKKLP